MYTEIPLIKRCCCCIPLRYGLLIWGYFVLTISLLLSTYLTTLLVIALTRNDLNHSLRYYDVIAFIYFVELWMEVVFSTVLIVAAHKKNEKLLKIYYYYAIAFTILFAMTSAITWAMSWIYVMRNVEYLSKTYISHLPLYMLYEAAPGFVIILINCYVIFLVRSEIVKLSCSHTFRFVNNAADSECKMNNVTYSNAETETSGSTVYVQK